MDYIEPLYFTLMNIWVILKNVKKNYLAKKKNYSFLTERKTTEKEYEYVLNVWNKFEMNAMKDYHELYVLLIFS